jgi:NAD+ diphosphatase
VSDPVFDLSALFAPPEDDARWMVVRGSEVAICVDGGSGARFPTTRELTHTDARERGHHLGRHDENHFFALDADEGVDLPEGYEYVALRALYPPLGDSLWYAAGRAVQLVEWARTHKFCGRCGAPTAPVPGERAMGCSSCGLQQYPRVAPAVIMIVHRGDEMLLAQGARFPMKVFSALAGFVEPGESLEQAVRREVREEVGVTVGAVDYFDSQSWPFPNSLMIGFYAAYESGDLVLDPVEILDAGWFRSYDFPNLGGGPPSIARLLIDNFVANGPVRRRANT